MTVLYYGGRQAKHLMDEDQYLTRCIVDPLRKTVRLLGSRGDERVVECKNIDEFMNVLEVCTAKLSEDQIEYADLAIAGEEV